MTQPRELQYANRADRLGRKVKRRWLTIAIGIGSIIAFGLLVKWIV